MDISEHEETPSMFFRNADNVFFWCVANSFSSLLDFQQDICVHNRVWILKKTIDEFQINELCQFPDYFYIKGSLFSPTIPNTDSLLILTTLQLVHVCTHNVNMHMAMYMNLIKKKNSI